MQTHQEKESLYKLNTTFKLFIFENKLENDTVFDDIFNNFIIQKVLYMRINAYCYLTKNILKNRIDLWEEYNISSLSQKTINNLSSFFGFDYLNSLNLTKDQMKVRQRFIIKFY